MPPLVSFDEAVTNARLPQAGSDLMIAIDMDGTTLHPDMSVSARVVQAIQAHLAAGTKIIVATGRDIPGAHYAIHAIGIPAGHAVVLNGAATLAFHDSISGGAARVGSDRLAELSPGSSAHQAASLADESEYRFSDLYPHADPGVFQDGDFHYSVLEAHSFNPTVEIEALHNVLPQAYIAVERLNKPRLVSHHFPPGELIGESIVVPIDELCVDDATRVTVRAMNMTPADMADVVADVGLHGVEFSIGYTAWLDIAPEGISKAVALEKLRQYIGISSDATVAVGDSGNDLDMLSWAHLGVVMGQAPDYVKAHAMTETASVEEDGLALALERLL
ncbi:MAG: HAD family hydrolase [Actinomycetaceae bacterium]|nr:HAD family hydrolase [Actinomycetaceae bacterium]MDY6082315.1 HAD family hydrolase [Actinomycetaceae bacterium]